MINLKIKNCIECKKEYKQSSPIQKVCVLCRKAYRNKMKKKWANENKDRDKQNRKKWYWNNLEKLRNTKRKWNNSAKGKKYRSEYYLKNKDRLTNIYNKYSSIELSRIQARRAYIKAGLPLICNICKDPYKKVQIHHIDFNGFNNDLQNLTPLCVKDHQYLHRHKRLELDQSRVQK